MEVLALHYLLKDRGGFYKSEALKRIYRAQVAGVVHILTWIGFMDSIQHWIYAEAPAELTIEQIDRKAAELITRFTPQIDWAGFEPELAKIWHYHHIFSVTNYRAALDLGNSKSVPELFSVARALFAFDRPPIRRFMQFLREQLAET